MHDTNENAFSRCETGKYAVKLLVSGVKSYSVKTTKTDRQTGMTEILFTGYLQLLEIRANWKAFSSQGKVEEFVGFFFKN